MSGNDDLLVEYDFLRQEVGEIDRQIRELQEHHANLLNARDSVVELKNGKGKDLLIPAGAGFYFNASLSSESSFVVNVGASVYIEMPVEKAEKVLLDRIDQALGMIIKLNEDAEAFINRLRLIEDELQKAQ